jgi:CelD/BcsL family acetyltransferase involved in cellulose biosynthesis
MKPNAAAAAVSTELRVELVRQSDARWLDFVARAQPTLFQTPRWCNLISEEYGFPAFVALALNGSTVVGGLPYAEVEDFRGRRRVAYAFSDFCEPMGDPKAWAAVEAHLCDGAIPWQIRSRIAPLSATDSLETPGVHQAIDLPTTMAEAAVGFHQKQRVNALRLERAGATCRCVADETFVEPFFSLFARLRKHKFRLLPQSRLFFERVVASYFPDRGFGLLAEIDGNVVAAMILLAEGDTLYVKYSASNSEARELRPTNYLFREAIAESITRGYRRLDLGISIEEGLQRFKRHLGAASVPYYAARYAQLPEDQTSIDMQRALSSITHILTEPDVPLSAAISAGAVLYRYFV